MFSGEGKTTGEGNELREKTELYGKFLDETLHPRLKAAVKAREQIEKDISEYEELQHKINKIVRRRDRVNRRIQQSLTGMVDLGHGLAFSKVVVDDPETIYLDVGYGFHVEFTLGEAFDFCTKRINFLKRFRLTPCVKEANEVARHYEQAVDLLESLRKEMENEIS